MFVLATGNNKLIFIMQKKTEIYEIYSTLPFKISKKNKSKKQKKNFAVNKSKHLMAYNTLYLKWWSQNSILNTRN